MNIELKEKEIIKDYYLKRILITLPIISTSPFATFGLGVICEETIKKIFSEDWGFGLGIILGLVMFSVSLGLLIYYSTKFWKAHKECQELANPTLTAETATESEAKREREREREGKRNNFTS